MSWLKQFLQDTERHQLPPGPAGSSELVVYEQRADRQAAGRKTPLSLTLVHFGLTIVNVVIFALLVLS